MLTRGIAVLLSVILLSLSANGDAAETPRKCFKCQGEGRVVKNTKVPCDMCDGTGVTISDREIDDTKHSTDGYWNYRMKTTRVVKNKQPCKKCGRSGKMNVKKRVACSVCKGSGLLTKTGKPHIVEKASAPAETVAPGDVRTNDAVRDEGEPKPVTARDVVARIRADRDVSLRANEISVTGDRGWAEFRYTVNQGVFTIVCNGSVFKTKWVTAGKGKVFAGSDFVEKVGCMSGQRGFPKGVSDFASWCWKYKNVTVEPGEVVAFMNEEGRFLAVEIKSLATDAEGESAGSMQIEFRCY